LSHFVMKNMSGVLPFRSTKRYNAILF